MKYTKSETHLYTCTRSETNKTNKIKPVIWNELSQTNSSQYNTGLTKQICPIHNMRVWIKYNFKVHFHNFYEPKTVMSHAEFTNNY